MWPELGDYAFEVLLAYAGSLAMLAALLGLSVWQSRRAKQRLDEIENRRQGQ